MNLRSNILVVKACKRGEKVHNVIDYQLPRLYAKLEKVIYGKFKLWTRPDQMWAKLLSYWLPVTLLRLLFYSQLSPCGHLVITDTPIIRTAAKSSAKINYRRLTEILK